MELCPLKQAELLAAARENLVQTYLGLALGVEGTQEIRTDWCRGTMSLQPYSFCNFVLDLRASGPMIAAACDQIRAWSASRQGLRVFSITGDQEEWIPSLRKLGFHPLHSLKQLVWNPPHAEALEATLLPIVQDSERVEVSKFMVQQFFAMNEAPFRRVVVDATAKAPHQLVAIRAQNSLAGAAMLSKSPGALGLYNVCVAPGLRRRGFGEALVRAAQAQAQSARTPLILQCDENLVRWYAKLGFQVFGEMQSFQCRF